MVQLVTLSTSASRCITDAPKYTDNAVWKKKKKKQQQYTSPLFTVLVYPMSQNAS